MLIVSLHPLVTSLPPPQYELVVIKEDGVEVIGPISIDTNWSIAHYVKYVLVA